MLEVTAASKQLFGIAGLLVLEAKLNSDPEIVWTWSGALLFPFPLLQTSITSDVFTFKMNSCST